MQNKNLKLVLITQEAANNNGNSDILAARTQDKESCKSRSKSTIMMNSKRSE
jgi:hypothetical protein